MLPGEIFCFYYFRLKIQRKKKKKKKKICVHTNVSKFSVLKNHKIVLFCQRFQLVDKILIEVVYDVDVSLAVK